MGRLGKFPRRIYERWDKRVNTLVLFLAFLFFCDMIFTLQGQNVRYWGYFLSQCPAQTPLDSAANTFRNSIIPKRCVEAYSKENPEKMAKPGIFDPQIDSAGIYPNKVDENNPIGVWALVRGPSIFAGLFVFYVFFSWALLGLIRSHAIRLTVFFTIAIGHVSGLSSWIRPDSDLGAYFLRNIPNDSMIPKDVFSFGMTALCYVVIGFLIGKVMHKYILLCGKTKSE